MMRVIKRYSFEGATPEQLEGALRAAGLQMRGKAEPVVSTSSESMSDSLTMKASTLRATLKLDRTKGANARGTLAAKDVTG